MSLQMTIRRKHNTTHIVYIVFCRIQYLLVAGIGIGFFVFHSFLVIKSILIALRLSGKSSKTPASSMEYHLQLRFPFKPDIRTTTGSLTRDWDKTGILFFNLDESFYGFTQTTRTSR